MNKRIIIGILSCTCFLIGCTGNRFSVWKDSLTSSNYKTNPLWDDANDPYDHLLGPREEEFIALNEEDLQQQFSEVAIPPPKNDPGEGRLPGIEGFSCPKGSEAEIFKTLYFHTDKDTLEGKNYYQIIDQISQHLKRNPQMFIFVEGHCDHRGSKQYNLSLGARRANYIRSMLVQKGVHPERIHTVSYGKEKPVTRESSREAWAKNRRAEFKIYNPS
ncbi:MAG: OmpA family protein [Chlamydiales bacterium]|jgi:peptidoglycan-associated lipoprotein|nr:OmpA family protein [Chlamydiales bacterium]